MEYSIFKEVNPEETIEKIKKILEEIEFPIEERIIEHSEKVENAPFSLRVYFTDLLNLGTNGKGTSLINAKASAYAEFIERLQNDFLFPFNTNAFVTIPDSEIVDISETDKKFFHDFFDYENSFSELNTLASNYYQNYLPENKSLLLPFYGFKEKNVVKLPIYICNLFQSSNGMAAGNTIEEALVQGLSEICERFSLKKIIEEKILMPTIPASFYNKYEKVVGMIRLLEEHGYNVLIKDASLGMGFPVVCVIIENTDYNYVTLSFGAHPSFPVAIERCLTEYAQGFDITSKNVPIAKDSFISKEILEHISDSQNMRYLEEKMFIRKVQIETCAYIKNQFFNSTSDYDFSENSWISNNKNCSNKTLLKFILNKIENYTSGIYIRDVSYLGFPSVYIIIPKMSYMRIYDFNRVEETLALLNWCLKNEQNDETSIKGLFNALNIRKETKFFLNERFSEYPNEYIKLLCALYLKDYENVKLLSETIIDNSKDTYFFRKEFISKIMVINEYSVLKLSGYDDKRILSEIKDKFSEEDVKKFMLFFKYLSADIIKKLIKMYNYIQNDKMQYNLHKEQIDKIISNLSAKYKEGVKNQLKLKDIFEVE